MGLRVDTLEHVEALRAMREAGVSRIEWDADGSVSAVEFRDVRDTEPAPALPASGVHLIGEEVPSDRVARSYGWTR